MDVWTYCIVALHEIIDWSVSLYCMEIFTFEVSLYLPEKLLSTHIWAYPLIYVKNKQPFTSSINN